MILTGDCRATLRTLPDASVNCVVTSPPYWGLRSYTTDGIGEIGLERTPEEYVAALVGVFAEAKRVLRDDGTVWLNIGDCYAGSGRGQGDTPHGKQATNKGTRHVAVPKMALPAKNLIGIPWRVAFALQADGWILRRDIIWEKPNPMTEAVTDRPTSAHEYIFLFSKKGNYWYDAKAIAERAVTAGKNQKAGQNSRANVTQTPHGSAPSKAPRREYETRNIRSVWRIATANSREDHHAMFPDELARRCILAGCPKDGTVLDPFLGSGTVAIAAERLGRKWIGCELNPKSVAIAKRRIAAPIQPEIGL